MTVSVTDNRTAPTNSGADATTGFTSPVAGESIALFTSAPTPVELSGCLGINVSTQTSEIQLGISSTDLSSTLIYVWVLASGVMDTKANGGIQLWLDDGTNGVGYDVAGSDVAVFRHSDGQVGWQCLLLDTANLPAGFTASRGSEASLSLSAITGIGAQFKTLAKAVGGVENCYIDQIRYGTSGLTIDGGTSGARGTFLEIAIEDRDNTSGKAYGILRELASGLYGCQGPLTFGNTGTASHYFEETDFTVVWEDRALSSGRYGITLQSNATGIGSFKLGNISGTQNGVNGGSLIMPASSGAAFDASAAALDECLLYGVTFKNWTGAITFSDDATNGIGHDVFDCIFDTCGQINPGRVDMKNCKVINSAAAEAMLLNDNDNTLWGKVEFTGDSTGHAIKFRPTGAGPFTLNLRGVTFPSGYASSDGSTGNEMILFDPVTSTADLTISISEGGDTPSVMKTGTGTVTKQNNKTVTFQKMKDNTEVRVYDAGDGTEIAGIENATTGSPDNRSFAWQDAAGNVVDYVIHNFSASAGILYRSIRVNGFTVPNNDVAIDIQQQIDRNVS